MKAKVLYMDHNMDQSWRVGEVYDMPIDTYLHLSGLGYVVKESPVIDPVQDDLAVEQPETLEVFEPVATVEPLPETDDLAVKPEIKSKVKKPIKHKRK